MNEVKRDIWARLPEWLKRGVFVTGVIGGPLGLVLSLRELLDLHGPAWANSLAWFGAVLVVVSLAAVYIQQHRHLDALQGIDRRYRRDAAMAVGLPDLHQAFHYLRDAAVMIRGHDSDFAYRQRLASSLQHMAQVFSVITGAPCRMCIKELFAGPDAPDAADAAADERFFLVRTLVRHDGSYSDEKDGPSPLHLNSDFRQVWSPGQDKRCFFSNDLDREASYSNPHRDGDPTTFDYSSTIVWPIQREKGPDRFGIIGFLCVDSKQKDIFQYQNDFDLGAAYADTLYTVLSMRDPA